MKISRVVLYDEPSVPEIDLDGASEFIQKTFNVSAERRGPALSMCDAGAAYDVAASRIRDLSVPFRRHEPSQEEVGFEMENVADTASTQNITYYDGFELQSALGSVIPEHELSQDTFHVIFTNKLTCTYDHTDCRYHGRALIGSNPSIISTTGIIEAPAKPREYYMELIANSRIGINVGALKEKFRGTFLEYHDPRIGEIVCGYIMQAVFYYETQEAFCGSSDCRLYNAHWQKDLLHSQLDSGRLCERHRGILEGLTMT